MMIDRQTRQQLRESGYKRDPEIFIEKHYQGFAKVLGKNWSGFNIRQSWPLGFSQACKIYWIFFPGSCWARCLGDEAGDFLLCSRASRSSPVMPGAVCPVEFPVVAICNISGRQRILVAVPHKVSDSFYRLRFCLRWALDRLWQGSMARIGHSFRGSSAFSGFRSFFDSRPREKHACFLPIHPPSRGAAALSSWACWIWPPKEIVRPPYCLCFPQMWLYGMNCLSYMLFFARQTVGWCR